MKICTNFLKICTNCPKICTNCPKIFTNFSKRCLKNIVTRFFNNFRIYGTPPSPGVTMILKVRGCQGVREGLREGAGRDLWEGHSVTSSPVQGVLSEVPGCPLGDPLRDPLRGPLSEPLGAVAPYSFLFLHSMPWSSFSLVFRSLLTKRKFLGILSVFSCFSSVFLGVFWGSKGAKIPWCFGWFSLVST